MMNERTHLRECDGYWSTLWFIETGYKLLNIIFIYNQILTYLEIVFYSIFQQTAADKIQIKSYLFGTQLHFENYVI